jgi:3-deoxy-D-manno-octulosonic acid kinase
MKIEQLLTSDSGYLFNTALVSTDPAIFDLPSTDTLAEGLAGRATVRFAQLAEMPVVIKRYHRGGMVRHLTSDLYWFQGYERSRSWREIRLLCHMRGLDLPVPVPVAGSVERAAPGCYRAGLITGRIEASASLGNHLVESALATDQWHELGLCLRRFHEAGICHADLNAHNILIDADGRFHLIDFDRGTVVDRPGRWCQANLDRLLRSLKKIHRASSSFHFGDDDWDNLLSAARVR